MGRCVSVVYIYISVRPVSCNQNERPAWMSRYISVSLPSPTQSPRHTALPAPPRCSPNTLNGACKIGIGLAAAAPIKGGTRLAGGVARAGGGRCHDALLEGIVGPLVPPPL